MNDPNLVRAFMKAFIQFLARKNNTLKSCQWIKAWTAESQEQLLKARFLDLYYEKSHLNCFQFLR